MGWTCPICKSTSLSVTVSVSANLTQSPDGNFETSADGDHEWDGASTMWCNSCHFCDAAASFDDELSPEITEQT